MDAIVVAATRVLEREGAARLTTTRIAEVAGVSVGSLYQYFPHREAIVGAIIDGQLDEMLAAFRLLVAEQAQLPLDIAIALVLQGMLEASRRHERLHAPLFEEMAAARRTQRHACTLAAYAEIVAGVLAERADVHVEDPRIAAFLIVHATDGVIRSLVTNDDCVRVAAVIGEASRMLCRYLAR